MLSVIGYYKQLGLVASSKTLIIGNPETLKLDQGRFLSFRIYEFFQLVSILAFQLFDGDI